MSASLVFENSRQFDGVISIISNFLGFSVLLMKANQITSVLQDELVKSWSLSRCVPNGLSKVEAQRESTASTLEVGKY